VCTGYFFSSLQAASIWYQGALPKTCWRQVAAIFDFPPAIAAAKELATKK
jgi:hypothetical protein